MNTAVERALQQRLTAWKKEKKATYELRWKTDGQYGNGKHAPGSVLYKLYLIVTSQ